jgi:hypothetical protein
VIAVRATAHVARQHTGERPLQGARSCNVVAISSGRPRRRHIAGGGFVAAHIPAPGSLSCRAFAFAEQGIEFNDVTTRVDWPFISGHARSPSIWSRSLGPVTGCAHGADKAALTAGQESHDRVGHGAVDGIRILMFLSPWPSGSPVRIGFPNRDATGPTRGTKRGNI